MPDGAVHEQALEGGSAILRDGDFNLEPLVITQLLQGASLSFGNKELLEVVGYLVDAARSWAIGFVLADALDFTFDEQAG